MKPLLYLAYDGMLEPLGQSQVLAYLERLAAERPIHLLSFEKAEDWRDVASRQALSARIDAAGGNKDEGGGPATSRQPRRQRKVVVDHRHGRLRGRARKRAGRCGRRRGDAGALLARGTEQRQGP